MDTLHALRVFVRTLELGSLSAAAREFGTTQPTVSKWLARLERQLRVRLVERSTRGLSPTEQGQRFYADAKRIVEQFDAAVGDVQGMTGQAAGLLRINAPVALGQFRINAMVQRFLADHPAIDVELILNDRFVDLVEEGVDVAFRLGGTLPPDAIGRHLATVPRFLVAAPMYLARRGVPSVPDDLATHDVVRFAWTPGSTVELFRGEDQARVPTSSRFRVNNALAIREALVLGGGIGVCPDWLVRDLLDSGELVRVLDEWAARPQDLTLLYPSRQFQALRTRLFIDFAVGQFSGIAGFAGGQG
ncbi:LysR family transcriptional regulator [Massilia sp. Root133]|uniref:LysR family transcriptional regulator n=1 Tax=Massilia cellulosiltytica TaxID=2683234 RepID=A0A7X3K8X3_9BURK|nr:MULTISPECIES: LysR family transcriptional regulator [Telluria group]KQY18859.1 LysR family transcriptional regulator [Massilia sp. Root133]KQZ53589.1 LysR family transcriptional regulator [Massilia sp. Root1485]MVW61775.1 LysR family transcriptional regulator [Telluria cellulosilytica]